YGRRDREFVRALSLKVYRARAEVSRDRQGAGQSPLGSVVGPLPAGRGSMVGRGSLPHATSFPKSPSLRKRPDGNAEAVARRGVPRGRPRRVPHRRVVALARTRGDRDASARRTPPDEYHGRAHSHLTAARPLTA